MGRIIEMIKGRKARLVKLLTLGVVLLCWGAVAHGGYSVVELEPDPPAGDGVVAEETVLDGGGQQAESEQVALRPVTINLRGAVNYETVEIFNRLLHNAASVSGVERIRMIITPSRPLRCLATWEVMTADEDTFLLEAQLYADIRKLDPNANNDVLRGMLFDVTAEDIEQVKTIRPVSASLTVIDFSVEQRWQPHRHRQDNAGLLYAGFD